MITTLVMSFVLSVAAAFAGLLVACKAKNISRKPTEIIALGLVLGFGAFLLHLIYLQVLPDFWYWDEAIIGFGYAFVMADAKIWSNLRW